MNITKATRWRVFAGVWLQSLFTSATAYFSLFCIPLTTKFGWSDSAFALAYTIYMFTYCAVGFIGGSLAEKISPRKTIYIGLCLFAGGWFLTGFASSIPQLYVFYGLMAGAGGGMIYPACLPTALKWFPDRSGSISGLVQAGASCGPFIMSPIAQTLIDRVGAQMTCRILAIVFLIGVGIAAAMIVPCPEGWTPEGWKPSAEQAKVLKTKDYNIFSVLQIQSKEVLICRMIADLLNPRGQHGAGAEYLKIFLMVSFTSPIAQRQVGQTAMTAAFCVSIMTLANMCGRIGFGFIYDILKGWKSLILLMVINGASMLMLTQATTLPYFIVCIVLVGFSFGGLLVVFAPMVRMIFGSKFYNRNYGLIFIGYGIGAFVGPKISAYFYDTTGQYTMGFIGSAVLAVAAIVLIVIAQKMAEKMENAQ